MDIADRPLLITDACTPYEEQLTNRKRRYATLMGGRLLLLILAGATYSLSPWIAVAFLALSVPLPWMAVLIANDAPPHRREDAHRLGRAASARQLTTPVTVTAASTARPAPSSPARRDVDLVIEAR